MAYDCPASAVSCATHAVVTLVVRLTGFRQCVKRVAGAYLMQKMAKLL